MTTFHFATVRESESIFIPECVESDFSVIFGRPSFLWSEADSLMKSHGFMRAGTRGRRRILVANGGASTVNTAPRTAHF